MRPIDADALEEEIRTKDIMGGLNYQAFIRNAPTIEMQQPCEDAISRQAVLDVINLNWDYRKNCIRAIEALPPVTPQQKYGKWIAEDMFNGDVAYLSNSDLAMSLRTMRITGISPSRTEAEMLDEAADRIEKLDRVYKWIERKEHEMSVLSERG
jgi:hypothetical protein